MSSDEFISLSMSSISSSTMSRSVHFLFAPIAMLCVWKEQNCVTYRRLCNYEYVPNLLCSLMNCYILSDLQTVLLLKVRSITEWKIGCRLYMACIQRVYTEFICYSSLLPSVQNVQPNALCQHSERNEMCEYQRYIQSVLNIVAHICNEYLKRTEIQMWKYTL